MKEDTIPETVTEIEELETATSVLYSMCLDAGDWMVQQCPRHSAQGLRYGRVAKGSQLFMREDRDRAR